MVSNSDLESEKSDVTENSITESSKGDTTNAEETTENSESESSDETDHIMAVAARTGNLRRK